MNITKESLINYLQSQMNDFIKEKERYGVEDRIVDRKYDAMIACKEMVESLIGEPVNLGLDGKVTTGF